MFWLGFAAGADVAITVAALIVARYLGGMFRSFDPER